MRSVLVTVALAATAAAEDPGCAPAAAGVCQHRGVDSKASRWRRGGGGAAMPRIVRGVIFDRRADVENWRLGRERTRAALSISVRVVAIDGLPRLEEHGDVGNPRAETLAPIKRRTPDSSPPIGPRGNGLVRG